MILLRYLGLDEIKTLMTVRSMDLLVHDKVVTAMDCILSLVGDKSPEHYFVATQDSDLREKL